LAQGERRAINYSKGETVEVVENLVKTTLGEIEKVLSTKTVVGDPIIVEGATIIPLISIGFGFGAGGGSGKGEAKQRGEGAGGATAGVAWVRPKAVVIVDKEGVRVESIRGGMSTTMEKIGVTIPEMIEKTVEKGIEKWGRHKKEG
jgi:uncharacterized spore protein YtfJ